jgi:hypothetical protein
MDNPKVTVTFTRETMRDDDGDTSYLQRDYTDVPDKAEREKYKALQEIACEIIDGKIEEHKDYVTQSGTHYRWFLDSVEEENPAASGYDPPEHGK